LAEFIAFALGMQIPFGICAQISQEEAVWQCQKACMRDSKEVVPAKGSGHVGRALDAGL